jgi:hypothetical protein
MVILELPWNSYLVRAARCHCRLRGLQATAHPLGHYGQQPTRMPYQRSSQTRGETKQDRSHGARPGLPVIELRLTVAAVLESVALAPLTLADDMCPIMTGFLLCR